MVDEVIPGSEGHHIVRGTSGKARYRVGWESAEHELAATGAGETGFCSWVVTVGIAGLGLLAARRAMQPN